MPVSVTQQFDIFAQVVALGNIAASARTLGLSPAVVVEAMNELEDRLGYQLFTILDGSVELTPAGRKAVMALAEFSSEAREEWVAGLVGSKPSPIVGVPDLPTQSKAAIADEEVMVLDTPVPDDSGPSAEPEQEAIESDIHAEAPRDEDVQTSADVKNPKAEFKPKHFEPQSPAKHRPPTPSAPHEQTITLASHPSIFSHFQETLVAFEQASPDIGINLRLAPLEASDLDMLFSKHEADIAYFYALDDGEAPASRYAWSERISLFVSADHKLARKDSAMAEDLMHVPRVTLGQGNPLRTLTEQALEKLGLPSSPPVLETDNLYEIMKYVEGHDGYFAAFGPMARDFGKMSGIARLAYAQGLPQVQIRQAVHPEMAGNPAVLALAEFLFH